MFGSMASCVVPHHCCDHILHSASNNSTSGEINCHREVKPYKVLELFSGIGGMHYALRAARIRHNVVAAVDINTVANQIYQHNFSGISQLQRNILSFNAEEVDILAPDIITMSPPCQPFSRLGLQQDISDPRTKPFLHLLELLPKLQKKPLYILIENVKGFEVSYAQKMLTDTLNETGYVYQEFLLSPTQLFIPNSRLRYYLLAKLKPLQFSFPTTRMIEDLIKYIHLPITSYPLWLMEKLNEACGSLVCYGNHKEILPLSCFLENKSPAYFEDYLLSDKVLEKHAMVLDIVNKLDCHSCCFTKAYGHYVRGTGSVLHCNTDVQVSEIYREIEKNDFGSPQCLELLRKLRLRYFTPREIANIMCFPHDFNFPDQITTKQRYSVLGNSINVSVVSELLKILFTE